MAVEISRPCFDMTEYYRMAEAGILSEDDHVELIEGEVIEMNPIDSRHAACVNRLNMLLSRRAEDALIVSVQNPIRLKHSTYQVMTLEVLPLLERIPVCFLVTALNRPRTRTRTTTIG